MECRGGIISPPSVGTGNTFLREAVHETWNMLSKWKRTLGCQIQYYQLSSWEAFFFFFLFNTCTFFFSDAWMVVGFHSHAAVQVGPSLKWRYMSGACRLELVSICCGTNGRSWLCFRLHGIRFPAFNWWYRQFHMYNQGWEQRVREKRGLR